MHELHGGTGTGLDARRARQTPLLILEQRAGDVFLPPGQDARESPSILDALSGARCEERYHRVRRVAEQRDAARTPAIDRIAVIHAGDEGRPALDRKSVV